MPIRAFELNRDGSQIIAISQSDVGAEMTIMLNDRLLGTLTTPEELSAGRSFTLDDGSSLMVQAVNKQVQVRHNGLPLFPARLKAEVFMKAARYDKAAKRIIGRCVKIALMMGLIALGMIVVIFFFQYFTLFTGIPSIGVSWPGLSTDLLAAILFLIWAICLSGYVLLVLLACIVGCLHAAATHRWKWSAFIMGPLMLLGMVCLVLLLRLIFFGSYTIEDVRLDLVPFLAPFPVSVGCLFYAQRLE